jgi:hypothetical protein
MKFHIQTTAGGEVIFAGYSRKIRPKYYGAAPETGLWRVDISKFERFLSCELEHRSFGESIEVFVFGLEIAELKEWGRWFSETSDYMSYRTKGKELISVGQIEWKEAKDLSIEDQLQLLGSTLVTSIERIGLLKRKPKAFDYDTFGDAVRDALSRCTSSMVAA